LFAWFIQPSIHPSVTQSVGYTHFSLGKPYIPTTFPLVVYKTWGCLLFTFFLLFFSSCLCLCLYPSTASTHTQKGKALHYTLLKDQDSGFDSGCVLWAMGLPMRQKLQLQLLTQNRKRIPYPIKYLLKVITKTTEMHEEEKKRKKQRKIEKS